ncbi:uncharacterized protein LOC141692091 [Apium graveolens]|uniref:uncharacterized protein LOC141692091 n=1 Tax=Apium graveolens TaxID=4045 RepID=UPI003D7B387E
MARQERAISEMEESFAKFSMEDEDHGGISYEEDSTIHSEIDTKWCLVGKFLTDSSIDFHAMQHKMASLWRPGKGMYVKQLDSNRFLFQFYHEIDIKRVCDGSPWTFGHFHLVFERLKDGMDPRTMCINNLEIWVQLHDLGAGFMSQRVVTDIGNYIGRFVESDTNNFVGVWRDYFRVRVSIPLDVPLKRRMRLRKNATEWCWVRFKYEAVPTFCFICGLIGHSDRFCDKLFETQGDTVEKPYGTWMRADPKRRSYTMGSKWLRSGGTTPVIDEAEKGKDNSVAVNGADVISVSVKSGIEVELPTVTEVNGAKGGIQDNSKNQLLLYQEKTITDETNMDNNEILITDLKRRRLAQETMGPSPPLLMSLISWNCQGLGPPWKLQFLQDVIRQQRPAFVFLCKTLSNMEKMEWVRSRIGFQGMIAVEAKGRSGGLAMLWKDQDQVDLLSISDNHIDIAISENGVHTWRLTGFYGEPDRSKRRRTWELLKNLSRDSNLSWCTIGDMNNILSQSDKRGGAPYPQWLLEGFNETVMEAGLTDLELYGHKFTWERGRNTDAWIEIRLDRALATESWLQLFPDAKLYNLEGSSSDHSAIFLDLVRRSSRKKRRFFRFENAWLTEPLCSIIVQDNWEDNVGLNIQQKIQRCAENLGDWGKKITGGFNKRIRECHQKLKQLRRRRDAQPLQEYKDTKHQLYLILDQKEIFWRQRSKQLWLNAGDKNTKYFHAACNKRQRTNRITKLKDGSGEWLDWKNGLENLIQSFYSNLFTTAQVDYGEVVDCVSQTLDHEHNSELTKDVTREEVRFAIFQMHPDKAPGPDGMTPAFFQKHWHIGGEDVYKMVKHFFVTGDLIDGLNDTNIILIPKKKNLTVVGDLRPIALCNVLMKIITKVMANRMKGLLDHVVTETQSAFIPNRLISDNVMISYEIMHYLKGKRTGKDGYMALKLDISKAYDRIEWEFLRAILLKMGFSQWWVYLVLKCVTTVAYTISHANPEEALRMRDLLEIYERATGQQVNKSKSTVFYSSNVLQYNREFDKVNAKIRTWDGNFISRSGKEILVKHVAQTLPTYAMNVFLLPLEITRNIEQCLANFWWNSGKANSSSLHWMSWDILARDKNAGGMGFRHFRDFNIAMLGKQLWRLITNPTGLVARLYKAKYFATVDVFQAELGHNPSFIWRSLLEAKQLLLDGSRWRVGDGQHIQILGQPWLLTEVNPFITSNIQPLQNQVVASLMKVGAKEWDLEVVADVLNERDQNCVLAVPISNSNQKDSLLEP